MVRLNLRFERDYIGQRLGIELNKKKSEVGMMRPTVGRGVIHTVSDKL